MTDDIHRMLADACENRPIHAGIDDVVRRGRRRVRQRRSGGAAFSLLAVGGVLAAAAAWPSGGSPAGEDPAPVAAGQPGPTTIGDDEVIERCLNLDDQFTTHSENKAGGGTDPIVDWSVAVTQAHGTLIRAMLVSPDGERFAYCRSDERGTGFGDYYREAVDLGPDFDAWILDGMSQGTVPDGVARLTFETPDGTESDATIVDGFYLWYSSPPTDWGGDPVWATFYDADGNVLERINANPASSYADLPARDIGDRAGCGDDWEVEDRPIAEDRSDQAVLCREDAG